MTEGKMNPVTLDALKEWRTQAGQYTPREFIETPSTFQYVISLAIQGLLFREAADDGARGVGAVPYYCSAHDETGRQFGSFTVEGVSLAHALQNAGRHGEVRLRPEQAELRVKLLDVAMNRLEGRVWLIAFGPRDQDSGNYPLFWRPNRRGYTNSILGAGLYTEQEAKEVQAQAERGGDPNRQDVAVPLTDYAGEIERLADALGPSPADARAKLRAFAALAVQLRREADGVEARGYSQQADRVRDAAVEIETIVKG